MNDDNIIQPTPEENSGKKEKKNKVKLAPGLIALVLILSLTVSAASGAASSYLVMKKMQPEKESTAGGIPMYTGNETSAQQETEAPETFMPPDASLPEESTGEKQEAEAAPLSKGDIYSSAVNSIYAIKSEYDKAYSSIFGTSYAPVTSSGTGFAISDSGYILTNYHVIENGKKITVTSYSGKEYTAAVVGSEPDNDIAVIKIDSETIPVTFGASSDLKVGDDIMVIGNALGELSYTFTDGIISHLSRSILLESGKTINMFQTNAAINSGNSGGPVYNMKGEVVGIASAKYASESVEGLGFCIPVDDINDMVLEIILYGYVKNKPSMGVSVQTVTSSMAARYRLPRGCYIVAVKKDSAAHKAGLLAGDVITDIDKEETLSHEIFESALSKLHAGDSVEITYSRNGESGKATLTLDEYKPAPPRTSYTNVHDY